eukprot:TRINITY_DN75464_c0_g1_i1.p1 TRINITY_DN75464_c0_g1~~TRINITY_DN75464_c0_g1_i1.p1  ORF type:complete len:193 (-),score=34.93 TRINITY_DN75464_c0_g1_i1:55-606(-)
MAASFQPRWGETGSDQLAPGVTLLPNSASRKDAVTAYVAKAMAYAQANKVRLPELTTQELRAKESREGLNNIGRASMPQARAKGWDWCFGSQHQQQADETAKHGLSRSSSMPGGGFAPMPEDSAAARKEGFSRFSSFDPCPHGERPFFGEARALGDKAWDGRMKGGQLARDGWNGTFVGNGFR